jgi:hypothetical protein
MTCAAPATPARYSRPPAAGRTSRFISLSTASRTALFAIEVQATRSSFEPGSRTISKIEHAVLVLKEWVGTRAGRPLVEENRETPVAHAAASCASAA